MKAKIKVKQGDKVIKKYTIEYDSARELNALYQEAREVWAEYDVVAETPSYDISYSHTYKEQNFKH
jgi:uncharacterized protein RhaS with RHS repeats